MNQQVRTFELDLAAAQAKVQSQEALAEQLRGYVAANNSAAKPANRKATTGA